LADNWHGGKHPFFLPVNEPLKVTLLKVLVTDIIAGQPGIG